MTCFHSREPAAPNPTSRVSLLPSGWLKGSWGWEGGRGRVLCSVRPFPWCKNSHHGWLRASNSSTTGSQTFKNWLWGAGESWHQLPPRQGPPANEESHSSLEASDCMKFT